jgi:predicted nucleic acid-binding protein
VIYCDSNYLVRLYWDDPGWEKVRRFLAGDHVACSLHGRGEVVAALHRKLREGQCPPETYEQLLDQFRKECDDQAFRWLPLTAALMESLSEQFRSLPRNVFLRAADALHLACARDHGFKIIYSNDERLLAAAPRFGLKGKDILA